VKWVVSAGFDQHMEIIADSDYPVLGVGAEKSVITVGWHGPDIHGKRFFDFPDEMIYHGAESRAEVGQSIGRICQNGDGVYMTIGQINVLPGGKGEN